MTIFEILALYNRECTKLVYLKSISDAGKSPGER
jgi:hypothetical protein